MTAAPPSARSPATGWPELATMASTTSRVCRAMDSTTARTMWAFVVPRVTPDERAPGVRVPPGAAEAGEGGNEVDVVGGVDRRRRAARPPWRWR